MILIYRDPEPEALNKVRQAELTRIVKIARKGRPSSKEIGDKYKIVAADLWRHQLYKCAFCEHKLQQGYNDVEHYRPKAKATRHPGCAEDHGYWWLAFTWSNLFFACPTCNRSYKRTLFPLAASSVALEFPQRPPGKETPMLIDAAVVNGVEHIEFVFSVVKPAPSPGDRGAAWPFRKHWHPRARRGSKLGEETIRVCGLDDGDHIELYDGHVEAEVRRDADDLLRAIERKGDVRDAFDRALRLLQPTKPFVGLSYDALRTLVPNTRLAPWKLAWPEPHQVCAVPFCRRSPRRA